MSQALPLAGFQVTLIGRFWVIPEEVQQLLTKVLDGTLQVKTYEVSHSTVYKLTVHMTA